MCFLQTGAHYMKAENKESKSQNIVTSQQQNQLALLKAAFMPTPP